MKYKLYATHKSLRLATGGLSVGQAARLPSFGWAAFLFLSVCMASNAFAGVTIAISPSNATVQVGESITFTANPSCDQFDITDPSAFSYAWSGDIFGATTTDNPLTVTPTSPGNKSVTVTVTGPAAGNPSSTATATATATYKVTPSQPCP